MCGPIGSRIKNNLGSPNSYYFVFSLVFPLAIYALYITYELCNVIILFVPLLSWYSLSTLGFDSVYWVAIVFRLPRRISH